MHHPRNYYFDMDGVLAKYDWDGYLGHKPPYLQPGQRYFLNRTPNLNALGLMDRLWRQSAVNGDKVFVLTSIAMKGPIFNEHLHDKMLWTNQWAPYLGVESFLVSVTEKRDVAEYIANAKLTQYDVLLDDFNRNLTQWAAAGGTAVKYCNGLNTPGTFDGLNLIGQDGPEAMYETLCGALDAI